MVNQATASVENHFIGGLKTEFTGLNFPENSATAAENCVFTIVGDVTRRSGINFEENFTYNQINRAEVACTQYKWNNAGGDGLTQIIVQQVGTILYFYLSSNATISAPLSTTKITSTVDLTQFMSGSNSPATVECTFADGNGYLFVYNSNLEPFYCTYANGQITATKITVQVRDFVGVPENQPFNYRPTTLNTEHNYNLSNQGWVSAPNWSSTSSTVNTSGTGTFTYTIATSLTISGGQNVTVSFALRGTNYLVMTGTVVSYNSGTGAIVVNITYCNDNGVTLPSGFFPGTWNLYNTNPNYISTWFAAEANYPSNADVWWSFKDTTNTFNPSTTVNQVTLANSPAPKGHFILPAFLQSRSTASGIPGITDVTTVNRPTVGCWFQGRVWYSGVTGSFAAQGDVNYYTWTENIYFSQIIEDASEFGYCYQVQDPTDQDLFELLPSDGGVIVIQGSGTINKLFPVQNGLLVFAANGIWFITGSQGIGFSATDYTITKISNVTSISPYTFVNVLGWPIFWNEEGIYTVSPSNQGGGLTVNNVALGTILSFYSNIPLQSKKYIKGDYDAVNYIITWVYRSTNETDITSRYTYDSALNFNTATKAFYPYTFSGTPTINGIVYVQGPGGGTSPDPVLKYVVSYPFSGSYKFTFAEENDDVNWMDFFSYDGIGSLYTSTFTTGYKLHGQAFKKFQVGYLLTYSRNNNATNQYQVQGIWDYAINRSSGKYSSKQLVTNPVYANNFAMSIRRHKIRGRGYVLQLTFTSVDGQPFDLMGWAIYENIIGSV